MRACQVSWLHFVHNRWLKYITSNGIPNLFDCLLRNKAMPRLTAFNFVSAFCFVLQINTLLLSQNTKSTQIFMIWNIKIKYLGKIQKHISANWPEGILFRRSPLPPPEGRRTSRKLKNKNRTAHNKYKRQVLSSRLRHKQDRFVRSILPLFLSEVDMTLLDKLIRNDKQGSHCVICRPLVSSNLSVHVAALNVNSRKIYNTTDSA